METNKTQIIEKAFNRYSDMLVNIADVWEETANYENCKENMGMFIDAAVLEVEKEMGGINLDGYCKLCEEIGRYAGIWINLYLNRAIWGKYPEWLERSVQTASTIQA